jgi:hypothetical protein
MKNAPVVGNTSGRLIAGSSAKQEALSRENDSDNSKPRQKLAETERHGGCETYMES